MLFYMAGKKEIVDLADSTTWKMFSNRLFQRDISINLTQGDILLYYSRGNN